MRVNFNERPDESHMGTFCESYRLKNLIIVPKCYAPLVNRFWSGKCHCDVLGCVGLACDVLKSVFLHQFSRNLFS